jgi:two-component system, NtrC family, sensor kinase
VDRNRRILIIDDNPAIHEDFRKVLAAQAHDSELDGLEAALFGDAKEQRHGVAYELEHAHQGQEGLAKVKAAQAAGKPHAVAFVDMRMPPGWDGLETIEHLWQVDEDLEVVICSAYSDHTWDEIRTRLGATDRLLILKKPFDNIEVQQLAAALTEKWALRRDANRNLDELAIMVEERTCELRDANLRLQKEMAERERYEIELRHAQKLEAIGRLSAGVAHEVNTPLQYVGDNVRFVEEGWQGLTQLLEGYRQLAEGKLDAAGQAAERQRLAKLEKDLDMEYLAANVPEALREAGEGLGRMAGIVKSLRGFAQPNRADKSSVDINESLQNTLSVAHHEWGPVANLETELGSLPRVMAHGADINQVFLNLVINATHAMADANRSRDHKGTLRVITREAGDHVEIEICDDGVGIPEAIHDRIFDPFFTTKEFGRGSGQGLTIARSIVVDGHGGSIRFESRLGAGTRFVVALPVRPPPRRATETPTTDTRPAA